MATFALEKKSIVIIGGTSGLGFSAARAFLAAGARVVVVGRDGGRVESAEKELGRNVIGFVADAADPKTAPAAINIALGNFQRFDGLYHVAGGSGRRRLAPGAVTVVVGSPRLARPKSLTLVPAVTLTAS